MATLLGENISLRALEPEDINFLFSTENNEQFWEVSGTQLPFSKYTLMKYLENAHQDIYEAKQYRFAICNSKNTPMGMIDLFDFNPMHQRVGIGILILPEYRNNGFATEALQLVITYAFTHLNVHQIFANIIDNNQKSISLFKKLKFKKVGIKKDWIYSKGTFKNEILYQLVKPKNES